MSGLQQTNYPISYSSIDNIKNEYLSLIYVDKKEKPNRRLRTGDFIGFSSIRAFLKILSMKILQAQGN